MKQARALRRDDGRGVRWSASEADLARGATRVRVSRVAPQVRRERGGRDPRRPGGRSRLRGGRGRDGAQPRRGRRGNEDRRQARHQAHPRRRAGAARSADARRRGCVRHASIHGAHRLLRRSGAAAHRSAVVLGHPRLHREGARRHPARAGPAPRLDRHPDVRAHVRAGVCRPCVRRREGVGVADAHGSEARCVSR